MSQQPWFILPEADHGITEAVVIGGGLAGTSVAYSLAQRQWKVTLIERESGIGQGASGNMVGIFMPLITHEKDPLGQLYSQGFHYLQAHVKTLLNHGEVIRWDCCGVLDIAQEPHSLSALPENPGIQQVSQQQAESIANISLASGGLYIPDAGWIVPKELCEANISAYNEGITVIPYHQAIDIIRSQGMWSVLGAEQLELARAPVVVIANANDALAFEQCQWLPIEPIRGQLTYAPECGFDVKTILCYGGYITPSIDGIHCIGATFDREGETRSPSMEGHSHNISALQRYSNFPDCDMAMLAGRVAFRAATPDRRACVGPLADREAFYNDYGDLHHGRPSDRYPPGQYLKGLYVSVGHGSRGLTSAPLAGEYLAALITGTALPFDSTIVDLLNPARFLIRDLKRNIRH